MIQSLRCIVVHLIMNAMTQRIIVIHSKQKQTEPSKKSKQKVTAFILSVLDAFEYSCVPGAQKQS